MNKSALATQVGGNHYKDCAIQPVQFIEANSLGFLEGCVVKRLCRHDKPTGKGRQDIEKAIHELQLLLEHRYTPLELAPPEHQLGTEFALTPGRQTLGMQGDGVSRAPSASLVAEGEKCPERSPAGSMCLTCQALGIGCCRNG